MAIFGFIGTGNMGGAMVRAAAKQLSGEQLLLANRTPAKAEALARELSAQVVSNAAAAERADYLFLGVKPQMMADMLAQLRPVLAAREKRPILVTMAAGLTIRDIQEMAGADYPVIRIMPNTPSAIGAGMVLYACGESVTAEERTEFLTLMQGAGRFTELAESLIDAGSCVSGCGPAFADLFLEALADGGVACGLPRATAMELAAQMLLGSAALYLENREHPGALKDAVCSPGGTTIQGVRTLEQRGFRAAVMDAVIAAYEKTKALS